MSNRMTYPASLFPLRGDISAEAGQVAVEVIGIQTYPIDNQPAQGDVPAFDSATNTIHWTQGPGSAITVDGVGVSADYLILCGTAITTNYGTDDFLGIRMDGELIGN
jgi:hypothetical protein